MDFLKDENVCGVVTQGRATGSDHYVKAFKVQVGPDEHNLRYLMNYAGQPNVCDTCYILKIRLQFDLN